MAKDITAKGYLSGNIIAKASLSGNITASASFGQTVILENLPVYGGTTEVTPSNQAQVLLTENKALTRNIVVNPIPEDYGRLLWSGNTLTVY